VIVSIPPEYAYGDKKQKNIPAGSTLVFYMELLRMGKVKGEKTTYGVIQGTPGGRTLTLTLALTLTVTKTTYGVIQGKPGGRTLTLTLALTLA
jgi:hypothetical protein